MDSWTEAERAFRRDSVHYVRGRVLRRSGRMDEAKVEMRRATDLLHAARSRREGDSRFDRAGWSLSGFCVQLLIRIYSRLESADRIDGSGVREGAA